MLRRLSNRIRVTAPTEADVRAEALAFAATAHALGPPEVVCRGSEYVLEQSFANVVADRDDVDASIPTVARARGHR